MRTLRFDNLAQRDWTPQRSEGAPQGRENATSVFASIPRWSPVRSRDAPAGFFVYGGEGSPMRTPGGLSDSGTIDCAGGRAAQINPISRYIEPLCASKSCSFGLDPPTMLATIAQVRQAARFDNLAQRDWTPQRSEGAPQGRENATSVFESIPRWSLVRSRDAPAGFFVYGGEGSPMRTPGGLSDSGTIDCAGGRAAQINPISRYIEPLCASKSCSFGLDPPTMLATIAQVRQAARFDNLAQRDWTPQRSEGAPQGRENATSVFASIPRWSLVRS